MKADLKTKLLIMLVLTVCFSLGFKMIGNEFWSGFQLAIALVYLKLYIKYRK